MNNTDDGLDAQILEDFKRVKSGQILPPGVTLNVTAEELAKELFKMAGCMVHKRNYLPRANGAMHCRSGVSVDGNLVN